MAKIFEDISQKANVCFEVEVVIVTQVLAVEGPPDALGGFVIPVCDTFIAETAVELELWW